MADTNDKRALERLLDDIVDCAVSVGMSEAMKGFGAFTEIDSISMTAMRRSISQKRAQILGHFDATATPPADAALADDLDAMTVCDSNRLDVFQKRKLHRAAAALRARAVPIEWRRIVRELMALANFKPLCQKNVMNGCRCYDCVMERAGKLIDEQTMLAASKEAK